MRAKDLMTHEVRKGSPLQKAGTCKGIENRIGARQWTYQRDEKGESKLNSSILGQGHAAKPIYKYTTCEYRERWSHSDVRCSALRANVKQAL